MSDDTADNSLPPDNGPSIRELLESKSSGASAGRTPDRGGTRFPDLEDVFPRVSGAADALLNAGNVGAAFANVGDELQGFKAVTDAAAQHLAVFEAVNLPDYYLSPPVARLQIPPDPGWDTARYTRELAEFAADAAAQREENERKEAERDAREERALKVAEDSLAEARRSRIITAWSVAIALISLIVAVITVLVA